MPLKGCHRDKHGMTASCEWLHLSFRVPWNDKQTCGYKPHHTFCSHTVLAWIWSHGRHWEKDRGFHPFRLVCPEFATVRANTDAKQCAELVLTGSHGCRLLVFVPLNCTKWDLCQLITTPNCHSPIKRKSILCYHVSGLGLKWGCCMASRQQCQAFLQMVNRKVRQPRRDRRIGRVWIPVWTKKNLAPHVHRTTLVRVLRRSPSCCRLALVSGLTIQGHREHASPPFTKRPPWIQECVVTSGWTRHRSSQPVVIP